MVKIEGDYDVLVGVLTYNDHDLTSKVLESIRRHTTYDGDYRVVVLDDGSLEEFKLGLRHVCAKYEVHLLEHMENRGIPISWNHLALCEHYGRPRLVVLLNNDIIVRPQWLEVMTYFLDNNEGNCASASWGFWRPTGEQVPYVLDHAADKYLGIYDRLETTREMENDPELYTNARPGRIMCPAGCCFGFSRAAFEKIGSFDEKIKSFHEESDFGTRAAAEHGLPSWCLPWPRLFHVWGFTFSVNPELQPAVRMRESREYYKRKWLVPSSFEELLSRMENSGLADRCHRCNRRTVQRLKGSKTYCCDDCLPGWWKSIEQSAFAYTHQRYMSNIPHRPVKWLAPDKDGKLVEMEDTST